MSKEQAVQPKEDEIFGMCMWTDGGARPNPGFAGWGLHGYMYQLATPKKGSGNPDHILTEHGYQLKSMPEHPPVVPIHYIDGFGSIAGDYNSNNVAEIVAATEALRYASEHNVRVIRIWTDSEYVRKGINDWVRGWIKNNWIKPDGKEVRNRAEWERLHVEREKLKAQGITVEFFWVKGHDDILGNMMADRKATLGVMHARAGKVVTEIESTTADGYWKYETERHPFISHRRMYFNTRQEHRAPGEYYLGEHGKDDDLLGKRMSDGAYALIRLAEPDRVVEEILKYQSQMAQGADNLMILQLDNLYRPAAHEEISTWGHMATEQVNPYRLDLQDLNGEPLTRELRPQKLAYRAVESIGFLAGLLAQYQAGDKALATTDLTPILYETIVKTGKKDAVAKQQLKEIYRVGFAALEVLANHNTAASGELGQESIVLTLGIDLLDRNRLKALEDLNPKVTLLTWPESEICFRHATVIEVDGAIGIWAGMYSNLRVLKSAVQS